MMLWIAKKIARFAWRRVSWSMVAAVLAWVVQRAKAAPQRRLRALLPG